MPVTREQYDAAKGRQKDKPWLFHDPHPSDDVLADVAAIREWEAEEDRRGRPDPPPCGTTPRTPEVPPS